MSGWGTNGNANRIKDTYIRGFLDVSGGSLIVEKTSTLQIMASNSDHPVLEFKPDFFTINTTSSVDVSYSALAALGILGISFEQSTADITGRVKYITTGTIGNPSVPFTEIGNDISNCQLQVYGLIKGHYGMDIDGDVSFNNKLFVNGDSSMNGNLSIGSNLYVAKNSAFLSDVSMNGNLDIGSGRSFVAINKDISAGFALDVSGVSMFRNKLYVLSDVSLGSKLFVSQDSSLNGNLAVGRDLSLNGNLYVSGIIKNYYTSSAIDASFALKTYVDTSLNSNYYIRSAIDASVNSNFYNRSAIDASFVLKTYVDTSLNTNYYTRTAIDASVNSNFYNRSAIDASFVLKTYVDTSLNTNYYTRTAIDASVNSNFYNKSATDASFALKTYVDTSLNTNYYTRTAIDASVNSGFYNKSATDASFALKTYVDTSLNTNYYTRTAIDASVNSNFYNRTRVDASFVLKTYVDTSLNTNYYTMSAIDVSVNSNFYNRTRVDASFVLKTYVDTSLNTNYYTMSAIDASVNSNFYNRIRVDASFVLKTYVDTSLNTNYYIRNAIDASVNSNFYNKSATDASFALKTYVDTSLNTNYYIRSAIDASVNSNFYNRSAVDASFVLKTYVDTSLNTNYYTRNAIDASVNGNFYNRSAVDASFALKTYVDTSLNTNYYTRTAIDASVNGNFYNRSAVDASFALKTYVDTSLNTNYYIRSAIDASVNSNFYNRTIIDASLSGIVSSGGIVTILTDSSLNGNVRVGRDLSLNGNLFVVGRSVFGLDVSMNGNLDIGSGNNSVSINKDISAGYALDVSGLTIFRNKMYVASDVSFGSTLIVSGASSLNGGLAVTGTLTLNGAPVSGGSTSSLTGNVQVGSNSGFVTIDKPQFYSDPSLIIYYDFDSASYSGTTLTNKGNGGSSYNGTLTGTTTGMIDTSEKKWGTASLKQNTSASNDGITISSTIPVSNTFSVSLWVKKSGNSSIDRLFEFSNVASGTGENETIALNINTSGKLVPIITNSSVSAVTLSNNYIYNYNIGDNNWNNIVWIVTSGKSFIYVNGSIGQIDTVSTITNVNNRTYGFIARTNNTTGYAVENANIDDFRYYKDKALNYAEIYQLYNNNFYTFDICGGFLANGSSVIYEPSGSKATASSGTLTLLHGDVSGSSSIMFKSVNDPLEYGYIQYEENSAGSTGNHFGLMTIGIENDGGSLNYTQQADRVSLYPSGGQGFVGVNTKMPQCSLDVSGTLNTNMDASINGVFVGKGGGNNATNTRLGFEALKTNTSGYTNVAIGYQALTLNNTGYQNVAVGSSALQSHTGTNCTGVGASALYTNSNGYNNVAVGSFSLYTNSNGYSNVAVGSFALEKHTATNCTAVGASALNANSTGYNNVAVGTNALQNITTQNSNTAIGFAAGNGSGNTFVGDRNTFIGSNTYQNGTGIENTYIGYSAGSLTGNYSGSTAIGIGSQITANNQIVLGRTAEFRIPGGKININPVSSSSKIVLRGDNNGTGNSFVLCNGLSSVLSSNRFGIALESASNTAYPLPFQIQQNGIIGIGYTNQSLTGSYALDISGNVNVTGNVNATSYNATSDYRIKKNVMPLDLTFNVDVLKPVSYVLKDDKDSKLQIGFIAHEVQEFYPFLVNGVKDGEDTQSINYNGFIGILTKEIKVLKNKVAGQEAKLLGQEARIQALEKLLNK